MRTKECGGGYAERWHKGLMRTTNKYWLVVSVAVVAVAGCSKSPEQRLADSWPMLDRYCTECHNDAERAGELSFERANPAQVAEHPELWERVVRRLRGSVMPPPGSPHPGVEDVGALVTAL